MIRRLSLGEEQVWKDLSVEAIVAQPECFMTTAEQERLVPLSWFKNEIEQRWVFTSSSQNALAVLNAKDDFGSISSMYVRGVARREGLGDNLMSAIRNTALSIGCSQLALQVFEDNSAALGLYRKHGFRVVSQMRYLDRMDLRMMADLK